MVNVKGFVGHESTSKQLSVDWYTPPWVFEKLNMEFDLDPCQPVGGIDWIPAKKYFTIDDDGLNQEWNGRVWLNPPYGKEMSKWLDKMHNHRNGVALLFSRTDCKWFHNYVATADCILFLRGRIQFIDGLHVSKNASGSGCGSVLVGWGETAKQSLNNIKDLGFLVNN